MLLICVVIFTFASNQAQRFLTQHSFVIKSRRKENYELVHIRNMDEMPVWFDMPSARTVNEKSAKTVLVNTTGHDKLWFTVVLACMADGNQAEAHDYLQTHGYLQTKDLATVIQMGDGRSWNEAVGKESDMAVTTQWSSKKEKSPCFGLLPSSSHQLSKVSHTPNKNQHHCNPRWFNQHSSTRRHSPKQAI